MARFKPRSTAEFVADYLIKNKAVAPGITRTRLITLIMEAFLQRGQTKNLAKQLIREAREGRKPGETMQFKENLKDWKPKVGQDPETKSLKMFNKEGDKLKPLNLKGVSIPGTKGSPQAQRQAEVMETLAQTPGSTGMKRVYSDISSFLKAVHDMEMDVLEFLENIWGEDFEHFTLISEYRKDQKAVAIEEGQAKVQEWYNQAQEWLKFCDKGDPLVLYGDARIDVMTLIIDIEAYKKSLDAFAAKGHKIREDLSKSARIFNDDIQIRIAHDEGGRLLEEILGRLYELKTTLKRDQAKWEESIKDKGVKA